MGGAGLPAWLSDSGWPPLRTPRGRRSDPSPTAPAVYGCVRFRLSAIAGLSGSQASRIVRARWIQPARPAAVIKAPMPPPPPPPRVEAAPPPSGRLQKLARIPATKVLGVTGGAAAVGSGVSPTN